MVSESDDFLCYFGGRHSQPCFENILGDFSRLGPPV